MKKKYTVLLMNLPSYLHGEMRESAAFPLGLGILTTYLQKAGHKVKILDFHANSKPKEEALKDIKKQKFDVIGVTAMSVQYSQYKWLVTGIKKHFPNCKLIVGGPLANTSYNIVLTKTPTDFCVIGEGEFTFTDLLQNMDDPSKVKGVAYLSNDPEPKIITTPPRPVICNLDDVEFPAWNRFPMERYLNNPFFYDGYSLKNMSVLTTRGCPWNCNYCSRTFKGIRLRSVENIIKELKLLKKKYNIRAFIFLDATVMIDPKRTVKLCKELKKLNLVWSCQGRANLITPELVQIMKDAGCKRIGLGIESGSQTILNNMNKNVTTEMALNALKILRDAKMIPIIQMMFGYPGENDKTIRETIEFCKQAHIHPNTELFTTTPLPGTQLYDYALEKGLIKDEEQFLERLESTNELLVNFTKWSNKTFIKKKAEMEQEILKNYMKYRNTHPGILLRDYSHKFKRFYKYSRRYGLHKAISTTYKAVKEKPYLIYNAEYK